MCDVRAWHYDRAAGVARTSRRVAENSGLSQTFNSYAVATMHQATNPPHGRERLRRGTLLTLLTLLLTACSPAPTPSAADVAADIDTAGPAGPVVADVPADTAADSLPDVRDTTGTDAEDDPRPDVDRPDALEDVEADAETDPGSQPDAAPEILGPPQTVTLVPHERPIVDPERGWVQWVNLLEDDLATLRSYRAQRSLGWAGVNLGEFRDAAISDEFLARLNSGLFNTRDAGLKVVLRFRYDETEAGVDAPLERVLEHITQLTPLLQTHSDVIYLLEAGFIGAWGEWHSSSNGLDQPGARLAILDALRGALPANRFVSVRTPMFKEEAYGGPLLRDDAFSDAPLARIGHHNDCFLASESDFGTYAAPVSEWVSYVASESRFVPAGGETCAPNPPRSECASALAELELLGFSYLSSAWHPEVLAAWDAGGCLNEIGLRLGHRLQVEEYTLNQWAAPGATAGLHVALRNVGFAPVRSPRTVVIWLIDQGSVLRAPVDELDSRDWRPGALTELEFEIDVPSDTGTYEYTVLLGVSDGSDTLAGVPGFATQFANDEMLPDFGAIQLGTITVGGAPAQTGIEFAVRGRQLP